LPPRLFFALLFFGTFFPERRASDNPIAIACFRLFTFLPERPLLSVPLFLFFIARFTERPAPFEYFRPFFAIDLVPFRVEIGAKTQSVNRPERTKMQRRSDRIPHHEDETAIAQRRLLGQQAVSKFSREAGCVGISARIAHFGDEAVEIGHLITEHLEHDYEATDNRLGALRSYRAKRDAAELVFAAFSFFPVDN